MKHYSLMKQLLHICSILLLSLSFYNSTKAQQYGYVPFPDSNAIWIQQYHFNRDSVLNINIIITSEDTFMYQRNYKKVFTFTTPTFQQTNATFLGGIREDSLKKVFYIGKSILYKSPAVSNDSTEILLYNFSVNVGDTLQVEDYPNLQEDSLIVRSIDTIISGNQTRRLIKIGLPTADFPEEMFTHVTWLEGVGKLNNFYCDYGGVLSGNSERALTDLSRFSLHFLITGKDTIYASPIISRCYAYLGVFNPEAKITIATIFPNPTNNTFTVSVTNSSVKSVKLYNITGQLVLEQNTTTPHQTEVHIDVTSLNTGLYHCVMELSDGSISTKRVVKE